MDNFLYLQFLVLVKYNALDAFIENAQNQSKRSSLEVDEFINRPLIAAFCWDLTPQGTEFWSKMEKTIKSYEDQ